MIALLSRRSSDPTWIVSLNYLCQCVLVLHLPLLLNLREMMLLSPAFCMRTAVENRSFASIVKEKATKR